MDYFLDDINHILEYRFTLFDAAKARNLSLSQVLEYLPKSFTFDGDRPGESRFTVMFDGVLIKYEVTANVPVKHPISMSSYR